MPPNKCINIFRLRILLNQQDADAIAGLNSALLPLALSANIIVMVTLHRTRQLRTRKEKLLFYLALSYTMSSLLMQPLFTILFADIRKEPRCLLEMISHYSYFLFSNVSSFIILGIGVDQLIQLVNIFLYKYALTRNKCLALTVFTGLASIVLTSLYILATCYGKHAITNAVLSFIIFLCALTLLLGIVKVRSKKNQINTNIYLHSKERNTRNCQDEITSTATIMLASISISNVMFAIAEILTAINGMPNVIKIESLVETSPRYWQSYALYLTMIAQPLNGVLYPIIFFYSNRKGFKYVVDKAKRICNLSNKEMTANV